MSASSAAAAQAADEDVDMTGLDLADDSDAGSDAEHDADEEYSAEYTTTDDVKTADKAEVRDYEAARAEQMARLEALKSEAAASSSSSSAAAAAAVPMSAEEDARARRINYLFAQSEVFAHFLAGDMAGNDTKKGKKGKGKGKAKAAAGGGGGRTKMSEAAEDAALMKGAQSKIRVTRLDAQPKNIEGGTMRGYQLEGLNWLVKLHDNNINGILADEMGLGKTLQCISLLGYLRETRGIKGKHIVIAPKSTLGNWMREFKRWCPAIKAVKLIGDKETRKNIIQQYIKPRNFDVVVTSYEGILREKGSLANVKWSYLIIDEAHRIKNENSSLSKTVRTFKTQFRVLVTGTPLQNNLHELWALLNFLLPDVFGNSEDFDEWFNTKTDESRDNVIKKLHTVLRPFMLRRVKTDVAKDLPPKKEVKLFVGLTGMQRDMYTNLLSKDATALNALGGPDRVRLLNILMQLRKCCNHPYLFDGAEPGPPFTNGPHLWENAGKLNLMAKLLPKMKANGSRCLIFCQMTRLLDILEDFMMMMGYQYCRIDGSTNGDARDDQMEEFNAPGSPKFCFLLSTRAGGLGINLQTADVVILYDSDWNPQVDLQAMDRAHRIGQTKPVKVYRLVTEGTVEEKIIERADRKLYLDAAVIQQGRLASANQQLSKGELMTMIKFGAEDIFKSKGATITDEDIDEILERGERKTAAEGAKIKDNMQHNLASFSLQEEEPVNLFDFDGVDGPESGAAGSSSGAELMINLPQRERKRNYDVNEYYRDALNTGGKPTSGERKKKGLQMLDFQFFDEAELSAILAEEDTLQFKRAQHVAKIKEARTRYAEAQRGADEAAAADYLESIAALEAELEAMELPPKLTRKKEKLMAEAFADWTRRDFRQFLHAMERNGRVDTARVFQETSVDTGKSLAEVKRYYDTFWKRHSEIQEYEKIIKRIEDGEKRILRDGQIRMAIAQKIERHSGMKRITLNYQAGQKSKIWNAEEDVFLVKLMHNFGHGSWDRFRQEIRKEPLFRFNWYFKSRSADDLRRRCDNIVRMIEKENEEIAAGMKDLPNSRAKSKKQNTAGRATTTFPGADAKTAAAAPPVADVAAAAAAAAAAEAGAEKRPRAESSKKAESSRAKKARS